MDAEYTVFSGRTRQGSLVIREINTAIAALIIATITYIVAHWAAPQIANQDLNDLVPKFVGVAWPFFAMVLTLVFYVVGATIVAAFALGAPRQWDGISQALHWATEACPLVGLLTTFLSLLIALLAYGEAGPGQPETQAAFISQFAIAFGSSIAGGVLALIAFTLHRVLPQDGS
jgi:hypothetical protein